MNAQGEMLKGHLEMLVLASVRAGALHGYSIIQDIRRLSGETFDLADGTVYPLLRRLEKRGHLKSRWSTVAGRRRRVYRLTASGRKTLAAKTKTWSAFRFAIDAVLEKAT